jgi:hypothetical protein
MLLQQLNSKLPLLLTHSLPALPAADTQRTTARHALALCVHLSVDTAPSAVPPDTNT